MRRWRRRVFSSAGALADREDNAYSVARRLEREERLVERQRERERERLAEKREMERKRD